MFFFQKKHACHYEGCNKIYSILTHLKRHIRTTHERPNNVSNKTIRCEVDTCDKFFTSLTNMHRHIREVHENPKVYKCEFCDEKFSQKLKMRRHEISKHTGVFPHTCDKCSKGFYQKWQWEKHTEACKVYPCLTCNKKFDKWTLFQKHCKETQHGCKYYKCEYCESAYVKPCDLQKHVAVKHISEEEHNSGEYKCQHKGCGRSYAYERNLRQHITIAHEGKKFQCTQSDCDKEFSSLQNLQKHIQRDHSERRADNPSCSSSKKKGSKSLKRKKRKDAGISKVSNLAKLSGINVDKELNKRLKNRESDALEAVAKKLSQETQMEESCSDFEVNEKTKQTEESKNNKSIQMGESTCMDETAMEEVAPSTEVTLNDETNIKQINGDTNISDANKTEVVSDDERLDILIQTALTESLD